MSKENNQPQARPVGGPGHGPRGGGPMMSRMNAEKPKNARATLGRLLAFIGKSKFVVLSLVLIMCFITLLNLAAPLVMASAIDAITITDQRLHVDFAALTGMLALLLGIYLLSSLLTLFQGLLSAKLSQTTVFTLRNTLFAKIIKLPIRYTDTHRHGDIMSRMTNDVENIANTISQSAASLISGGLTIIGSLVIMIVKSRTMTVVALVTIPLTLCVSTFLAKFMRKFFVRQQTLLGDINAQIEENITGFKTVIAYRHEQDAIDTFNATGKQLRNTAIKAEILGGIMGPLMNFIGNLGYVLVASVGGWLALNGQISVGLIQAFLTYSRQLSRPINEIAMQYAQIMTAMAGAERVFEILDEPDEVDNGKNSICPQDVKGNIEFNNINFSYVPEKQVLCDFNLKIKSGQKIAIVGATGSGKTTVVNLLTRFYDVDSGEILLDGVDIRDIPKDDLRSAIAIVLQDTVLFTDTIAANIRYGKLDASDEDVENAAQMSNADKFIELLPEKYQTQITTSGNGLSGGQRQLLAIARAVLADPRILILDEATSSVDTRTEMHIQDAMIALMKNRTSLIIAHRLSTIRDADMIIVIDKGTVVESGNHEQLLAQKGCYYTLYQNQFAGIQT